MTENTHRDARIRTGDPRHPKAFGDVAHGRALPSDAGREADSGPTEAVGGTTADDTSGRHSRRHFGKPAWKVEQERVMARRLGHARELREAGLLYSRTVTPSPTPPVPVGRVDHRIGHGLRDRRAAESQRISRMQRAGWL